jgi:hypothetical protein
MDITDTAIASAIADAARQWAYSFPMIVVWIVGLLFAFARWRRNPKVALLVILSCGLSLLVTFVLPIVMHLAITFLRSSGGYESTLMMGISLLWACLAATSTGLLLYAALTDRPERGW